MLRNLVILLVVVLALAVAADRIGVHVVQNKAADRLNGRFLLTSKPSVSINGFPFLTQVASGTFEDVVLAAPTGRVQAQGDDLALSHLAVELRGVKPRDNYSHASAESVSGSFVLSYGDVNKLMGDDHTSIAYGGKGSDGNGRVKFTTTRTLFGQQRHITGTAGLVVGKSGSSIASSGVKLNGAPIPIISDLVAQQLTVNRSFSGLPGGVRLQTVDPEADGVHVGFTGTNLTL
ncbi:hypothetical protein BIV57_09615 [Mangrovactinospora gilvigrisea]|uniref:DUF2993 domain-containing protein n=1 Tax=Mangrovactinospora gilvigrisea TaxID=1428644 RepID=A0A1J7CDR9_9ACTN|nr:hypothetical protein BIV57_09615 [Mangrovactinospora gilvigrisea]